MYWAKKNGIEIGTAVFFAFSMSEAQMDPNDSKSSVLDMEVEQVTVTDQHFWKWAD